MTDPIRVLLAGGGTAGHTSPLLATADALRRIEPGVEVTALGTPRGIETRVVPEAGYPLELVPPVPLPRRINRDLVALPARVRAAKRAAAEVIDRVHPDVVVRPFSRPHWPVPVSDSCGGTPRPPRSSWAIPGRSPSAARWPAWPC